VAKSLALQNEGACGVRQLADSFAHGTVEFEAAWLALADKSGDKSPQSKRCRAGKTACRMAVPAADVSSAEALQVASAGKMAAAPCGSWEEK